MRALRQVLHVDLLEQVRATCNRPSQLPGPTPQPQEDINEEPVARMWWPREIWGRYAKSLDAFKHPGNRVQAVRCLNHMVSACLGMVRPRLMT